MQIPTVSVQNTHRYLQSNPRESTKKTHASIHSNKEKAVTFKSLGAGPVGRFLTNFFETINSKLVYNFLILDAFGFVFPRVWQASNRNTKELGHRNYAAAGEELIREAFSGPAIVLLPILLSTIIAKKAGKSIDTSKHLLDEFHTITMNMAKDDGFQVQIAENLTKIREFSKMPAQAEEFRSKVQTQVTEEFYKRMLNNGIPNDFTNKNTLINKLLQELKYYGPDEIANVKAIVSTHNKVHTTFPERPFHVYYPSQTLKNNEKAYGHIATLVESAKHYIDDVVAKVAPFMDHKQLPTMVDNIQKKLIAGKIITGIGGVIAVATALRLIPVFYSSMHKTFPGVHGLTESEADQHVKKPVGDKQ